VIPPTYRILFFFTIGLLLSGSIFSQSTWDTLYLKNGQVVYGELKEISVGIVKFKMEGLNEASVNISKVRTIYATRKLYRVETISKQVFFSILNKSEKDGYVQVGDSTGGAEVPLDYLGMVTYYSSSKNLFEGNVSSGYNYTKSSNIGRFNLDAKLKYIMKKIIISNTSSTILTQENGSWYRDRESVLFSGTYLINSNWKAIGYLNYQLNRELGLQYRFQEGAAMGYNILSKSHLRFTAISGIVVNQEKSFEGTSSNFTSEIPAILTFDFFKFKKPELSVAADTYFYFSLTQAGRMRQDGELRIDWKVISDFTINLKFYYNYDNKPLSGQGSSFDYGTVFGIGYKWD
jgi:hypothetical protein